MIKKDINWRGVGLVAYFLLLIAAGIFILYLKNWDVDFILTGFFFAIITGFFGSIVFLGYLWLLKPHIHVAAEIALPNHEPDMPEYLFKFINRSWFFDLYEIDICLFKIKHVTANGGVNLQYTPLRLKSSRVTHMEKKWSDKNKAAFAHIVKSEEPITNILRNNSDYVELHIEARHSLSGFKRVFRKTYHTESKIKKGMFAHGDDFSIN